MNTGGGRFDREAFEERAAIMEFDGGMTQAVTESAAQSLLGAKASINFGG